MIKHISRYKFLWYYTDKYFMYSFDERSSDAICYRVIVEGEPSYYEKYPREINREEFLKNYKNKHLTGILKNSTTIQNNLYKVVLDNKSIKNVYISNVIIGEFIPLTTFERAKRKCKNILQR